MTSALNTACSRVGLYDETTAVGDSSIGRRIRRALDGCAAAIIRIIGESYGKESLQHAWREFTIRSTAPFLGDDPHAELFFSWLFHHWSPEVEDSLKINDGSCYGVSPTRAYLSHHGSRLDPLQRRYLEACLAARLCFYEILDCKPRVGFKAREVLTGNEVDVSESLASTTLQNGDIVFAYIVPLDGIALLEAVSPFSFRPTLKQELTELRSRREGRECTDLPLRRLYFSLLESPYWSPLPKGHNTAAKASMPRASSYETERSRARH